LYYIDLIRVEQYEQFGEEYKSLNYNHIKSNMFLGLGIHLFVKESRLGDSEGTFLAFESSCHLLLPV